MVDVDDRKKAKVDDDGVKDAVIDGAGETQECKLIIMCSTNTIAYRSVLSVLITNLSM
jgi:hypothetical protein